MQCFLWFLGKFKWDGEDLVVQSDKVTEIFYSQGSVWKLSYYVHFYGTPESWVRGKRDNLLRCLMHFGEYIPNHNCWMKRMKYITAFQRSGGPNNWSLLFSLHLRLELLDSLVSAFLLILQPTFTLLPLPIL